jgi:glycosyltransferase involved in cell wall biosynthesis
MPSLGGRGSSIVGVSLAEGLRRAGFPVRLCHHESGTAPREDTFVLTSEKAVQAGHLLDADRAFTSPLDIGNQMLRAHDEAPFGLLHLHSLPIFGVPAFLLKRFRGVPYVVTLHGSEVLNEHLLEGHRTLIRELLREAAAVTCVSRHLADALQRRFPELPPAEVVHNFLRPDLRRGHATGPRRPDEFLHVSSMREVKRPELMLSAFARVRQQRPGARLRIITTPRGLERASALLERYPYREDVTVLEGEHDPALLEREYLRGSAFVLTSRFESFGLVLLEALAHGMPVVAPAVGGIPEVLGENWPLLVRDSDEPAAYADRMLAACRAEGLGPFEDPMAAILERFEPSRQVAQYIELYRRALGSG